MSEEDEKKASCNGIWIQLYMVQVKSIQDLTLRFIKVGFASCELVESWRAVVAGAGARARAVSVRVLRDSVGLEPPNPRRENMFSVNTEHRLMRDTNCAVVRAALAAWSARTPPRCTPHLGRCTPWTDRTPY